MEQDLSWRTVPEKTARNLLSDFPIARLWAYGISYVLLGFVQSIG
jgi:hypothetical protein